MLFFYPSFFLIFSLQFSRLHAVIIHVQVLSLGQLSNLRFFSYFLTVTADNIFVKFYDIFTKINEFIYRFEREQPITFNSYSISFFYSSSVASLSTLIISNKWRRVGLPCGQFQGWSRVERFDTIWKHSNEKCALIFLLENLIVRLLLLTHALPKLF